MQFTDQNFKQEVDDAKGVVLVDFFAEWCGPCKMMVPIIEELANEYKDKGVKIGKLDIDENKEIAEKFNITGVPTFVLFKSGKIAEQKSGYCSKEDLEKMINKNL